MGGSKLTDTSFDGIAEIRRKDTRMDMNEGFRAEALLVPPAQYVSSWGGELPFPDLGKEQ